MHFGLNIAQRDRTPEHRRKMLRNYRLPAFIASGLLNKSSYNDNENFIKEHNKRV